MQHHDHVGRGGKAQTDVVAESYVHLLGSQSAQQLRFFIGKLVIG